jgi:hypothetical protein
VRRNRGAITHYYTAEFQLRRGGDDLRQNDKHSAMITRGATCIACASPIVCDVRIALSVAHNEQLGLEQRITPKDTGRIAQGGTLIAMSRSITTSARDQLHSRPLGLLGRIFSLVPDFLARNDVRLVPLGGASTVFAVVLQGAPPEAPQKGPRSAPLLRGLFVCWRPKGYFIGGC